MALLFSILRLVLPPLILIVLIMFVLPHLRRIRQQSDRIDVDATVVNSVQNKVDREEYEPSDVYVKQQDKTNTEDQN